MDIRCLNLQLCKDQGELFTEKGFKIPCLYDSQRQLELSYQEEKANLLQGYFCTSWTKTKTYIFDDYESVFLIWKITFFCLL